jgi:hypothetical protein
MNHRVAPRSSIAIVKLAAAAVVALSGAAIFLPACGSDTPLPTKVTGTFSGSTLDARNYCGIAGACQLFPDFGFGECMNQIARSEIELAPFGGDLGETARYECVKQAGSDCAAAKKCIGRVTTSDQRCTDPSAGEPFGNQPRSFCGANNRITVCNQTGTSSESFSCADDFAKQHFGGPFCVQNAAASALCGYKSCGDFGAPDGGAAPDGGDPAAYPACASNTLSYCTNGVEQRQSCSAFGGTCDVASGKCAGTCEQKGFHCKGTELVKDCNAGNELPLYDCAARSGWTCRVPTDTTSFGCAPPDDECAWGTFTAECVDGVKVRFCDDGKLNVYDCSDIGATCAAGGTGVTCKL